MTAVQRSPPASISEPSSSHHGAPSYSGGAPLQKVLTREQGFVFDKKAMLARIQAKEAARKAAAPKGPGDGTASVMSFKRDEYFGQRALYIASYGVGYFAGAPEGMMNVVRKAEKGVEKLGMTVDRNGAKRDRRNAKARAQLDAFAENAELEEAENQALSAVLSSATHATAETAETSSTSRPLIK
ncbi:hypothetical protein BDY24DRAFT_437842 [Mrakia frigida]|uniref:uncharacterized protein n=1 Tax=Mrakia frigida TaxID=29902 RepID=UPI003FCBEFAE